MDGTGQGINSSNIVNKSIKQTTINHETGVGRGVVSGWSRELEKKDNWKTSSY